MQCLLDRELTLTQLKVLGVMLLKGSHGTCQAAALCRPGAIWEMRWQPRQS